MEVQGPYSMVEDLQRSIDRSKSGWKRPGAGCAYLEPWHLDYEDFFLTLDEIQEMKRLRCHDMNTASWIPDIFMRVCQRRKRVVFI